MQLTGSETERRCAGVDVLPVVVDIGDGKMTLIFLGVVVRVSNKGSLEYLVSMYFKIQIL